LDLIAGMQSKRMDEQRVELPTLPGLSAPPKRPLAPTDPAPAPDEAFLEMLMRSQVRIRCTSTMLTPIVEYFLTTCQEAV